MKVLLFNGSNREHGCTFTALSEAAEALNKEGIETEILQTGAAPVSDCIGCGGCSAGKNRCVIEGDSINSWIEKSKTADGFVFGTPVYFAHPSGRLLSVLDRMFYAAREVFEHKPAAVVASARRGGTTASLDVLNKYPTIAQMPLVSSTYWNIVHGNTPEETKQDLEGMQTMRNLGRNMAWLIKCVTAAKKAGINAPQAEKSARTNFIRYKKKKGE